MRNARHTDTDTDTRYVIKTASASMPNNCWGVYRRVAVLEVDPSTVPDGGPKMISERARGVVRVVQTWERLNVGTTERCAYGRALVEARELIEELTGSSSRS